MAELTGNDLCFVVARIPKDIRELMKTHTLFLGGGFIRSMISGEKVSDIDLFSNSKEGLRVIANDLCEKRKGYLTSSKNAFTILNPPRYPIQFITRWLYGNATDVANSFDFTVCSAIIWFNASWINAAGETKGKWFSYCHENFYSDLAAKRLVYTFPIRNEDVGGSILRMRKFIARGYNIQVDSMAGVIARLVKNVNFKRIEYLTDDAEREQELSSVLSGLMREVDPNTFVDGMEAIDEYEKDINQL